MGVILSGAVSRFHELWWLTELSARKSDEERVQDKEDEDGPPESEEEKNDLTDDESMTTDEDVTVKRQKTDGAEGLPPPTVK